MVKNISKFLFISIGLFWGCDDYLDLEPQQSLDLATVYGSVEDLNTALIGSYNRAQDSDIFGCNYILHPDIMSNNVIWGGSFVGYTEISTFNITVTNGEVDGMYADTYRLINDVNGVIEGTEALEDVDQDDRNRLIGNSLFLRGAVLFESVRYFGQPYDESFSSNDLGLPLSLNFINEGPEAIEIARSTVAEVYNQAIEDLTTASQLLTATSPNGQANRFTALAYLAKIAFQQRDYEEAASLSGQIISEGGYSLVADPTAFYTSEFSSEAIWSIDHNNQDNPGTNGSLPTFYNTNGRGDITVDPDLVSNGYDVILTEDQLTAIENDGFTYSDLRKDALTTTLESGAVVVEKYEGFANDDDNAPMARLAEFILMRSESLARETGAVNQESIDLLNEIRLRSIRVFDALGEELGADDASPYISYEMGDFDNVDDLIEAIILERRVEFAFEGNRFHDLNRLRRDIDGVLYRADNRIFPMPLDATDNNSLLIQNPGY